MAEDMWKMINRELAKYERARAGIPDSSYAGAFKEAMEYGLEEKERREIREEERSKDTMKIMALQAGDYGKNYDNVSLGVNIKRLENYMAKNKGKLNETAMDYYDVTLNGLKDAVGRNLDFQSYQERLPEEQAKLSEYLAKRDKDQVWTAENIAELTEMQAPLVKFVGKFRGKHGARLASKAYQEYDLQLKNMYATNSFLLQSALDDGHLKDDEVEAHMINMQSGNTEATDRLSHFEDQRDLQQVEILTTKMGEQMTKIDEHQNYLDKGGAMPHPDYPESGELITLNEYLEEKKDVSGFPGKEAHLRSEKRKVNSKILALNVTDESYQKIATLGSYPGGINPRLLEEYVIEKRKKPEIPKIKTAESIKKKRKGLTEKQKDLRKLNQAEKQGKEFLDRALKNFGYTSKEALEKDILDIQLDVVRLPAMKAAEKRLDDLGQLGGKMTAEKWAEANPEEWERLVNEEHEKRAKIGQYKYR